MDFAQWGCNGQISLATMEFGFVSFFFSLFFFPFPFLLYNLLHSNPHNILIGNITMRFSRLAVAAIITQAFADEELFPVSPEDAVKIENAKVEHPPFKVCLAK